MASSVILHPRLRRWLLVLLIPMGLVGCVFGTKFDTMSPAARMDILPSFRDGRTVLDCRMDCSWQWIRNRRVLNGLYLSGQWDALAAQVSAIGFQEDLAYFWLGRAAEEEGYPQAAIRYYTIANVLTRTADPVAHCMSMSGERCFGINVLAESYDRMQALRRRTNFQPSPSPPPYVPRYVPPYVPSYVPPAPTQPFTPAEPAQTPAVLPPPDPTPAPAPSAPLVRPPDDDFQLPPIRP